jgi:hypothetical protein
MANKPRPGFIREYIADIVTIALVAAITFSPLFF